MAGHRSDRRLWWPISFLAVIQDEVALVPCPQSHGDCPLKFSSVSVNQLLIKTLRLPEACRGDLSLGKAKGTSLRLTVTCPAQWPHLPVVRWGRLLGKD